MFPNASLSLLCIAFDDLTWRVISIRNGVGGQRATKAVGSDIPKPLFLDLSLQDLQNLQTSQISNWSWNRTRELVDIEHPKPLFLDLSL